MPRNPDPCSIEELERDDAVHGPAEPVDEHRMLVDLSTMCLRAGLDRIESSKALLARLTAKFPDR